MAQATMFRSKSPLSNDQIARYAPSVFAAEAFADRSEQLLNIRRYEDRDQSLWTVFNRAQENLIRGGLRGRGATGKRTSTRAVASVTENVRLNKALWALTQRMSELKAA